MVKVEVMGRLIGHAHAVTETAPMVFRASVFHPVAEIDLPKGKDLVIDYKDGWLVSGQDEDGGGEITSVDLVHTLHPVPRM